MTPQSNGKLFTSTLIDFYLLTVFLSLRLEITYICNDALCHAIRLDVFETLSLSIFFLLHSNGSMRVYSPGIKLKLDSGQGQRDTRGEYVDAEIGPFLRDFVFECFIKAAAI